MVLAVTRGGRTPSAARRSSIIVETTLICGEQGCDRGSDKRGVRGVRGVRGDATAEPDRLSGRAWGGTYLPDLTTIVRESGLIEGETGTASASAGNCRR